MGLQGQHIILCASGNSSKSFGTYSFQEYLFSCSCFLYRLLQGFTALRPCALLRLQVTRTNFVCVRVSVMCINAKTKCKEKVREIKVGKREH